MRHLLVLLPALLLAPAAYTQEQAVTGPRPDTAPISIVQVTPHSDTFRLRNAQVEKIGGVYEMTNGWSIDIRADTRYIDAAVEGRQPIRLVAVSANKFISGDGRVTMLFNQGESGDGMLMSYVPDVSLSQTVVILSSMAQR